MDGYGYGQEIVDTSMIPPPVSEPPPPPPLPSRSNFLGSAAICRLSSLENLRTPLMLVGSDQPLPAEPPPPLPDGTWEDLDGWEDLGTAWREAFDWPEPEGPSARELRILAEDAWLRHHQELAGLDPDAVDTSWLTVGGRRASRLRTAAHGGEPGCGVFPIVMVVVFVAYAVALVVMAYG